jgi:predicted DNA-binding helix-hairpin-helix protein
MVSTVVKPDTLTKLTQMGDVTLFEPAGDQPITEQRASQLGKAPTFERFQSRSLADCISAVSTPSGPKPILKTMLTTACERNCYYCPFRAGRTKTPRITVTPDELASGFDQLQRAGQVDGLFLSSGIIKGSITTQDKLIDAATIIRTRYRYKGYIHLKIMPGAEPDQVYRAMQLANRVSVNLEGATPERLSALAPKKDFDTELIRLLVLAEQIRREHPHERLARSVTQFVVGAVGDTDLELLGTSARLYHDFGLTRAYYSAFGPVTQTPFENLPATAHLREHRLYQASFLLRDYAWELEDLPFEGPGMLRMDMDPKRAWAEHHLRESPIEIMNASREQLMRIPGVGPVSADKIMRARLKGTIQSIDSLRRLGLRDAERAADYVLLNGRRPLVQGRLF